MTTYVFHVHTYRCKHATEETDNEYIERAISLGARQITFTDHAPFPGDPFGHRMQYDELPEYFQTLAGLKQKYADKIKIQIGLEIEYLPSFRSYYDDLLANPALDLLVLGQHIYEIAPGIWNFSVNESSNNEFAMRLESAMAGLDTGYFKVMAHPDRSFRKMPAWTEEMQKAAILLIDCAIRNDVILEKNLRSMKKQAEYWEEFWQCVPETAKIIYGSDAHCVQDIKCYGYF